MIQSSPRNSNPGNYGWIQLSSSCNQFNLRQQRTLKNNFQEEELSHQCSTLAFVRHFVAAAATILSVKNLTSGELKARNSFLFDQKIFAFESMVMHDQSNARNSIPGIYGWI